MPEHTVKAYEQELVSLESELVRLGEIALAQVTDAVRVVVSGDAALAQQIIEGDAPLDVLEAEIEHAVVRLMARRQPMGEDLRHSVSALKIAANLERCGDLAKNIGKRVLIMSATEPSGIPTASIERLGALVLARLRQVLEAHRTGDTRGSDIVWQRDKEIDQQYDSLFRELLTYMMADSHMITAGAHLLFVAKNLERIGDHATNIAEDLHYQFTGEPMPGTNRPKWETLT